MVAGRKAIVLRAGEKSLIPPRARHNARDIRPEKGRMLSTYIVDSGQPLSVLVPAPVP